MLGSLLPEAFLWSIKDRGFGLIISASRRTDIPVFYVNWFFNRLKEGGVLVPNPFNPKQVSKISLKPNDVEAIVFWTKNVAPMLPY